MSSDKDPNKYTSAFEPVEHESSRDRRGRASFRKEPPVVPERVAVMKANYKQAWLYFLLALCLVFAWGIPIRYAVIRFLAFRPADVGDRNAAEFVALSYEGISDIPTEVSPERFEQQMQLLKENGYNAITLEEVNAFYEEGAPLPDKAVLLTFDHSRKSSYFDARRVLQRLGWRAVMFVWTKPIQDEDPSALRWPYIRAMIGTGAWEAGAQSHLGFERVVSDSEGRLKNYMTSPRWITREGRYETPVEYRERLYDDHKYVVEQITKETKKAPIAFAFPYGDFGQYDERAVLTRRLNLSLADEFYDLAFVHGNAALNTRNTDPLRLNRLLVNPAWSPEELLKRLESSWPREDGVSNEVAMSDPLVWQVDWGGFQLEGDRATLHALNDNTGSKVWLNGTDLYQNFQGKFKLRIEKGQVGFLLRATKDGESFVYLGLGDKGELWLRQKQEGLDAFTLGTSRYTREPDGSVDLEIYLRGNQFFALTGGEPVFEEIIMTRGEPAAGMIGLSVWDPEIGVASFDLEQIHIEPFYNRLLSWEPIPRRSPDLAGWLVRNGFRYTHLAPPWIHLGDQGRSEQGGWDAEYFRQLANVYNMSFSPEILVERIDATDMATAEKLAYRARDTGVDALYCNLSELRGAANLSRITAWIQNTSKALERQKIQLIVSLPRGLISSNSVNSLFQGVTNLQVAAEDEVLPSLNDVNDFHKRLVTLDSIRIQRQDHPLFIQLSGSDVPSQAWTTEVRSRILWEEGFTAYNAGQFDEAILRWERWSEVEPYNEKPLRLIGDVYLRKQQHGTAVSYYRKSLELNPGQVDLVLNTAVILEKHEGDTEKAAELLGLYHRLFPENSEIALAQAGLLLRQGKKTLAGDRIQEIARENPDDLTALALLQPLLQTSEKRMENLKKINELGRRLGVFEHFARTVGVFDLTLYPESWVLLNLIHERAASERPEAVLYQNLLPRETVVKENFRLGTASDNWLNPTGPVSEEEVGSLVLGSTPTSTEATLILKGSELMTSGFVEVELEEARGFFWLYARRSDGNMIRFGFEPDGQLYLQVWMNGQIITNLSRSWERPIDRVKLRLEIRGDGVFGLIDGKPAFGAPVQVPAGMKYGWWGMAPWSSQFGMAHALIREVSGGPLPVNIALYRGYMEEGVDDLLVDKVKNNRESLTVFSPSWFYQDMQGELRSAIDFDLPALRLLTRYYKIRLLPLLRAGAGANLKVDQLEELAKNNKVDGFTLEFTRMPPEEWFLLMEQELVGKKLSLLVIRLDSYDQVAEVRELGSSSGLIAGKRHTVALPLVDLSAEETPIIPKIDALPPAPDTAPPAAPEPNPGEETGAAEPGEPPAEETAVVAEAAEEMPGAEPVPVPNTPSVTRPGVPSQVFLF